MIEILLVILFCSLYCFGWWIITSEDMILYPLRVWADRNLPRVIYKPTFGCIVCYASVHGGSMYYFITNYYLNSDACGLVFPAMVIIAGLNYIMSRLSA